ncbi:MarR family winged helix-turn-helix transcriptional regulator [Mesorhizobium sp. J18]|uniref:MarR family winged helix-turn-helix transcriptional regulator n=1 Tax=Mesorhizobium sp. J18 TaxID=935263 RepID=UPI0011AA67AD|nr:MarR family winged helix-turn-helix transcriptional regulator [Mesorhizobium sp. J18]
MHRHIDPDSFGFLVGDLSRMVRAEVDRRIAEAGIGLTAGEARTLAHAGRAGTVRQNVLAERMGLEAMTVSAYLDRLEARGLVSRLPDPSDRRAKLVALTTEADEVLAVTSRISAEVRKQAAAGLNRAEWEKLLHMMKLVRSNLSAGREIAASEKGAVA